MTDINWLATLVAAALGFVLGGAWYSPALFGTVWQRETGDTRDKPSGHPARVFGVSFLFALVLALWL